MNSEGTPPAVATSSTRSSNGCGRLALISCLIFVCAFCCIISSIAAFAVGITQLALKDAPAIGTLTNQICNIQLEELNTAYDQRFTARYKQRVDFSEFRRLYTQNSAVFAACISPDEDLGVGEFIGRQVSFNYTDGEIILEFSSQGKRVSMLILKVGSDWLIDDLDIT